MEDRRNTLIREIARVCSKCRYAGGKGRVLECTKKWRCHSRKVKKMLKELEEIDKEVTKA